MSASRLALVAALWAQAACGGGAAKPGADGVSCDPAQVLCKSVAPTCPSGQVPSVDGSCWGECVPVSSCTCSATVKCPGSAVCFAAAVDAVGHCD